MRKGYIACIYVHITTMPVYHTMRKYAKNQKCTNISEAKDSRTSEVYIKCIAHIRTTDGAWMTSCKLELLYWPYNCT